MDELIKRLREVCVDWNGQPMHPQEEPRVIPDCGDLIEAADALTTMQDREATLIERIEQLEAELEGYKRMEDHLLGPKEAYDE